MKPFPAQREKISCPNSGTELSGLSLAPFTQDCLILEKNELHHPVCSFQDDFQEFEMIDDEYEEEEEEEDDDDEEEDDLDPDGPPSPPGSPTLGTLKSRPTTLNLTTAVSQVSHPGAHGGFEPLGQRSLIGPRCRPIRT